MRHSLLAAVAIFTLSTLPGVAIPAAAEEGHDHHAAAASAGAPAAGWQPFDVLKGLAGTWTGTGGAVGGTTVPFTVEFEVTAGGHAVIGRLFAGTPHEMLDLYRLEGDRVVVTHHCIDGTRPTMALAAASTREVLRFDFAGADNFDPAVAAHIHAASWRLAPGGVLEGEWVTYRDGGEIGRMWSKATRAAAEAR